MKNMEPMGRHEIASVVKNESRSLRHHCLTLRAPEIAASAEPGQFVMLYINRQEGILLPRPFSIFQVDKAKEEVALLFEIRGYGTELLAASIIGTNYKLLGPLGRGFPRPGPDPIFVAGGMGIAPLVFLASKYKTGGTIIYGARTADMLVCPSEELEQLGLSVIQVTEDGSAGRKGNCIDCLTMLDEKHELYACGPAPMLTKVAEISRKLGVKAWLSMEEYMACGIGACQGCVTGTKGGYKRVCHDGPVFPAEEVTLIDKMS